MKVGDGPHYFDGNALFNLLGDLQTKQNHLRGNPLSAVMEKWFRTGFRVHE